MKAVLFEKKGHIAYITLNRPEALNSFNIELVDDLEDAYINFRDDPDLFVGIIAANGRSFCTGMDIKVSAERWKATMGKPVDASHNAPLPGARINPYRFGIWKPMIAAVHGYAVGGGLLLALVCDIRIASDDAQFGIPEIKVGIPTLMVNLIPQFTFRGAAAELLFLGENISAERAYQLGLVNKVVKREELMPAAQAVAEKLAQNSPLALQALKQLLYRDRELQQHPVASFMENIYQQVYQSQDFNEGRQAFIEKRKPQWKGK